MQFDNNTVVGPNRIVIWGSGNSQGTNNWEMFKPGSVTKYRFITTI